MGTAFGNCTDCSPGQYAPAGSTSCTSCPAATELEAGVGSSAADCLACGPGRYAPESSTDCVDCPAGTYATAAGSSVADCLACASGLTSEPASEECVACPLGTVTNSGLASPCVPCAAGTYLNTTSTDINDCTACNDGQFAPVASSECFDVSYKHVTLTACLPMHD